MNSKEAALTKREVLHSWNLRKIKLYEIIGGENMVLNMKKRTGRILLGMLLLLMGSLFVLSTGQAATPEPYKWDKAPIGGGGYVTGLVIHPAEPDLVYIRTDVGGALRWDPVNMRWIPLLDSLTRSEWSLYGVDSIAVDPSNTNVLYAAVGKYNWSNGEILKSTDRGDNWVKTGFPKKNAANSGGKNYGERLAVDPNSGNIIYMGSRYDGLWKSESGASSGSWVQVTSFPTLGTTGIGLTFVVFDKTSGTSGSPSQNIYVGTYGAGVYQTTDGGATWSLLTGSPVDPNRAVLASDGTLYVSHNAGVAKYAAGVWSDITPPTAAKYSGITVDPINPNIIMTGVRDGTGNVPMYRSIDGGTNWSQVQYNMHSNVPWWPSSWWMAATSTITIDPHNSNRVWYTDFYGTWRTDNITASPSDWYTYEMGHEEVVTFALRSTPVGAPLFSGHADVDGMRHSSLTEFPTNRYSAPSLGDTTSIDYQVSNPNFVVRVGGKRYENSGGGGYSTDNGVTWSAFLSPPSAKNGRVAVSADSETIVWVPINGAPIYSSDRGQTWNTGTGAPSNAVHDFWLWYQPLASDRVYGNTFYLFDRTTGNFHRSTDGGANWNLASSTLPSTTDAFFSVKAAPGKAGEVWVGYDVGGLYRSTDSGSTWTQLPNVQKAKLFAFGKNRLGYSDPAVYVYGVVDNEEGIFRSDDAGVNWLKIDVADPVVGNEANTMEGDMQVWGRVYIGTNGSGVYYGESLGDAGSDTEPPTAPTNLASSSYSATTVDLTWGLSTDNYGVTGYNIYNGTTFIGTTTSTIFTVTGLTPSTAYSFTVKAKDWGNNESPASNSLAITTLPPVTPPTNLTSPSVSRSTVDLTWTASADNRTIGYNIYAGSRLLSSTSGTSFTVTDLMPDMTYAFTVKAKDSTGSESDSSNSASATTAASPGILAFNDDFVDGSADGWTVGAGNWSVTSGKVYKQSAVTISTRTITGDPAWSNYSVQSKVRRTSNGSPSLAVGLYGRYQDTNNYYLFTYKYGKLQIIKRVAGTSKIIKEKAFIMDTYAWYTFTGVMNNGTLEFYVNGIKELSAADTTLASGSIGLHTTNASGEFDDIKVMIDNDFTAPTAPANLISPSHTNTLVELSWTASTDSTGVTGYEVYNGSALAGTTTSTSYTVADLTPNTPYTFTVKAKDAKDNVSASSNSVAVTTDKTMVSAKNTLAAVTVDGSVNEAVWSMSKTVTKPIIGASDNNAEFGVLWDSSYLYVGIQVTDGTLFNDSTDVYMDDSVEIYIDGDNNKGAVYDSFDRQYIKGWNDNALFEKNGRITGIQHAWAVIPGGYSVELAIPWSELGIIPAADMTLGLDVAINDDDNGQDRESQLMWSGTNNNWTDTSGFGYLLLSPVTIGDTQPPTAPTGLTSTAHTDRSADLSWTASTDNVGVTEYEIYNGSVLAGTSTTNSYTVTGLTPLATYTFTVHAKDAEANVSAASDSVTVTMDESYTLVKVKQTQDPIAVDGSLSETVWTMMKPVSKTISGTPNNTVEYGVLWDSTYLYVGVKVLDENLYNDSSDVYADDSVEIYIDGNYNKGTTYDTFDRQFIKGWNDNDLFEKSGNTAGVLQAWSSITGGYTVEMAIPWSDYGITPAADVTIGFDVMNNDDDNGGGRESQLAWSGTGTNWTDTSAFGDLILMAEIAGEDTEAPSAPSSLASPSKTNTTVDLTWTASTDNVGVTEYDIYNGSTLVGNVMDTSYAVTGLSPNAAYTFTVKAKDAAGNVSAASDALIVTTDALTKVEAENYNDMLGIGIGPDTDGPSGQHINSTNNGDWAAYNVDFGTGTSQINLRVATNNNGGMIELRLGSTTGTLIGSVTVNNTGGWTTWTTKAVPVTGASGQQTLYLVFKKSDSLTVASVNWFDFITN